MTHDIFDQYRERWIAVCDDGTVVADAENLGDLLAVLLELPDAQASILRVPAADEPLFVGLR